MRISMLVGLLLSVLGFTASPASASDPNTGTVGGTVVDEVGNPVEGAQIFSSAAFAIVAETDSLGNYTVDHWPVGFWYVEVYPPADRPELFSAGSTVEVVDQQVAQLNFTLVAQRYGTMTGVVTDGAGQPASDVFVQASSLRTVETTTDAEGRYTLVDLEVGFWNLSFTPPTTRTDVLTGYGSAEVLDSQTSTLDITLPTNTYGSIAGVVTDEAGQPVSAVNVSIQGEFFPRATTDSTGAYRIDFVNEGAYTLEFTPTRSDLASTTAPVTVVAQSVAALDVVMPPVLFGTITGIVTDYEGAVVAGAGVSAPGQFVTTDANGSYTLTNVIAGPVSLNVSPPFTRADLRVTSLDVDVVADQTINQPITLSLNAPYGVVTGVVTDYAGQPVAGAQVQFAFTTLSTTTDALGRYRIAPFFPVSEASIQAIAPYDREDLLSNSVPVTLSSGQSTQADIQLPRASSLVVEVLGDSGAVPSLVYLRNEFGQFVNFLQTDADGRARFGRLRSGRFIVQVEPNSSDYAAEFHPDALIPADATLIDVGADSTVTVTVQLDRAASIGGSIAEADGSASPFGQVAAYPVGLDDQAYAVWRRTCNLTFDPGVYQVGCLHPAYDYVLKAFSSVSSPEYYQDTLVLEDATQISVAPGESRTGFDFQLDPKRPPLALNGISPNYVQAGTTTNVRIFGENFLSDPRTLTLGVDFFGPPGFDVSIVVTDVISPTEALATVTVEETTIGTEPFALTVRGTRADGSVADCTCAFSIGDATTSVGTIEGRVRAGGAPLANTGIVVRRITGSGTVDIRTRTRADGRWSLAGLPTSSTYIVIVEGNERWAGTVWRGTRNEADATVITLTSGQTVTVNATLQLRDPVKLRTPSKPYRVVGAFDLEIRGTGLSPITGGFSAVLINNGYELPLTTRYIGSDRIGLSTPQWSNPPRGTATVALRYIGDDGTQKETRCVDCVVVYEPLDVFENIFAPAITRNTTATVNFLGTGLADITSVKVSGTGVKVTDWTTSQSFFYSTIDITIQASRTAAVGIRTITITRADGSTTTTPLNIT
jgi:hypothetical protein